MKGSKILVTGGAGYIGSVLVPELVQKGFDVTVLDNLMYSQNPPVSANFIQGDIRDTSLVKKLISQFDIVIPLAAYVGAPICKADPVNSEATNKTATIELLRSLSPSQKIIMPTTNSAYGKGDKDHFCDENSPLRPVSDYALQKVEVEKALMEKENVISFRLATVFGMSPRLRLDLLVNDFTWRAVKDGYIVLFEPHFKRNYVHIRDVAGAFLHGIKNFEKMKGNIYNVGLSEANITKAELCKKISEHVKNFTVLEAPFGTDPDQRDYIVSNAKIEATGFKAKVSLDEGIQELIGGYKTIKRPFTNI